MKIHHTIHIPKDYDRLDDLERYLYERFPLGLHDFKFVEGEVDAPNFTCAEVPPQFRVITGEGEGRSISEVHFGVQAALTRFSAQDESTK